ncbi:hypothetical protein EET67_01800 [Pseudaminobacter arsenicus]|uniref:Phasin domain-containing protein n=1 Tax=Borborobacter arsenicus TaxID=1851146 RepID=A0A432VBV8_9HYPH|nr:hypothetical protein [Pseudaminobacter arsenicus]RUM99648.1 hypothetical protein EET67_01800 [Pseudaminobacter arsenicus]
MTSRRSYRATREAMAIGHDLMLAPMVMAMRLPLMAMEARDKNLWGVETTRAISEKNAALVEGIAAAQMSLLRSATAFWFDVAAGRTPALMNGAAVERSMRAAMKPASRQVKANYRRLSKSG